MRHRTLVIPHGHGTVIHRAVIHALHVAHVVIHTLLAHALHRSVIHAFHRTHVHPAHVHATHAHAGHVVTHTHTHTHTHIHHGEQRTGIERRHFRLHAKLGRQRATRIARAVERLREDRV